MGMLRVLSLGTAVLALPASGNAHWQYTRWHMSPAEVVKAAKNQTKPAANSRGRSTIHSRNLLDSTYQFDRFIFDVHFLFNPQDKLTSVSLALVNSADCYALKRQLSDTYGPSTGTNSGLMDMAKWWDRKNGNVLMLLRIGEKSCNLEYSEFAEGGSPGGL